MPGQVAKKQKTADQSGKDGKKKQAKVAAKAEPVIEVAVQEEFSEDSDSGDESEAEIVGSDEEEDAMSEGVEGQEAVDQESAEKDAKSRAEQKALRLERKVAKPNGDLVYECKKLWERVRVRTLESSKRDPLMAKMAALIKGQVSDIIFKHDASRVIQTVIKYGSDDTRKMIATELSGKFVELSKSKYGKFIVLKLLKYLPTFRRTIIAEFFSQVTKLLRHAFSRTVMSTIYSEYALAYERQSLMSEFYGAEFVIFKSADTQVKTLVQIFQDQGTSFKKPLILKNIRGHLDALLSKATTDLTDCNILQRVIMDYLNFAPQKDVESLLPSLKDHVVHILHTREGSQVARKVMLWSQAKDRKYILKTLKSFVKKIAMEQYGFSLLVTVCECVDDTVLVGKVLSELKSEDIKELAEDKWGSRFLLHILSGRNKRYLPVSLVNELEADDETRKLTCKKDDQVRAAEILTVMLPLLVAAMADKDTLNHVMRVKEGREVAIELINCTLGDVEPVLQTLTALICSPPVAAPVAPKPKEEFNAVKVMAAEHRASMDSSIEVDTETHILLHPVANKAIKILIKSNIKVAQSVFEQLKSTHWKEDLLFEYWIKHVLANRELSGLGFVFVGLLECNDATVVKESGKLVKKLLKGVKVTLAVPHDKTKKPTAADKKRKAAEMTEAGGEKKAADVVVGILAKKVAEMA